MQTTVIVPCHNEARRLQAAEFQRFVGQHSQVRFLFVNDGSSDATLPLLEQLAAANPAHFALLNLAQNSGKAEAIRQGVMHIATQSHGWSGSSAVVRPSVSRRAEPPEFSVLGTPFGLPQPPSSDQTDYIGYWDADLATPLDEIPGFIEVLDRRPEIALVIGSRVPLLGHDIHRRPIRRLLGRLFSRVTSLVLALSVHDTQCGAKLFRATPEMLATFSQPFGSRWIFDVELLARMISLDHNTLSPSALPIPHSPFLHPLRTSIYERPLDHWQDVAGSKLKRGDFFKAIAELSAIWWRYLRPAAPPFTPAPLPAATPATAPAAAPRRAA